MDNYNRIIARQAAMNAEKDWPSNNVPKATANQTPLVSMPEKLYAIPKLEDGDAAKSKAQDRVKSPNWNPILEAAADIERFDHKNMVAKMRASLMEAGGEDAFSDVWSQQFAAFTKEAASMEHSYGTANGNSSQPLSTSFSAPMNAKGFVMNGQKMYTPPEPKGQSQLQLQMPQGFLADGDMSTSGRFSSYDMKKMRGPSAEAIIKMQKALENITPDADENAVNPLEAGIKPKPLSSILRQEPCYNQLDEDLAEFMMDSFTRYEAAVRKSVGHPEPHASQIPNIIIQILRKPWDCNRQREFKNFFFAFYTRMKMESIHPQTLMLEATDLSPEEYQSCHAAAQKNYDRLEEKRMYRFSRPNLEHEWSWVDVIEKGTFRDASHHMDEIQCAWMGEIQYPKEQQEVGQQNQSADATDEVEDLLEEFKKLPFDEQQAILESHQTPKRATSKKVTFLEETKKHYEESCKKAKMQKQQNIDAFAMLPPSEQTQLLMKRNAALLTASLNKMPDDKKLVQLRVEDLQQENVRQKWNMTNDMFSKPEINQNNDGAVAADEAETESVLLLERKEQQQQQQKKNFMSMEDRQALLEQARENAKMVHMQGGRQG